MAADGLHHPNTGITRLYYTIWDSRARNVNLTISSLPKTLLIKSKKVQIGLSEIQTNDDNCPNETKEKIQPISANQRHLLVVDLKSTITTFKYERSKYCHHFKFPSGISFTVIIVNFGLKTAKRILGRLIYIYKCSAFVMANKALSKTQWTLVVLHFQNIFTSTCAISKFMT